MRNILSFGLCVLVLTVVFGCEESLETEQKPTVKQGGKVVREPEVDGAQLVFSLSLDQDVYEDSDFGEAPQFAIWLESPDGSTIKTVFVTYRTGSGDWKGKITCPAAVPYWVGRYNKETGTKGPPRFDTPIADALTAATPKQDFSVDVMVPAGSKWKYFVEVNASGDYNVDFPSMRDNGEPDPEGNGQPSLIYQGEIEAVEGAVDRGELIGRTDQWHPIDYIIADVNGITNAKNLLSKIEVICRK